MKRFSRTAAVLTVTSLVFVGGGAYAVAASTGGTITACVNHRSGTLYKATRCWKHDTKLSWNTQGPQGPVGATGATGATGPRGLTGPQGPSNAFTAYNSGFVAVTGATTVESVAVPAGSYVVIAKVVPDGPSAQTDGHCDLKNPSGSVVDSAAASLNPSNNFFQTVSLTGPVTTTGGNISVVCSSSAGALDMFYPHISAIQVGTVTGS
jgi:hypothetical protein